MEKIVFFLETKNPVTERQTVLLDLAAYIADNTDNEVFYVNTFFEKDAALYSDSKLHIMDVATFDFSEVSDARFFTPINYLLHLLAKIKDFPSAKIALYVYDSQALNWLLFHLNSSRARDTLVTLFSERNACAFLNYSCTIKKDPFNRYPNELFIPIALHKTLPEEYYPCDIIDKDVVNIAFCGNLNYVAINSINNLIHNIALIDLDCKVDFHFIGNRSVMPDSTFSQCSTNRTRLIFTGSLEPKDKEEYIRQNVDIVFASDENAIETSTFGVPVVLPVINNKPFIGNNYSYLFNVTAFEYSWNTETIFTNDNTYNKFAKIYSDIYIHGRKKELAKACYDYCKDNCSLESISDVFFHLLDRSTLEVKDCMSNTDIYAKMSEFDDYATYNNGSFSDFLLSKKH